MYDLVRALLQRSSAAAALPNTVDCHRRRPNKTPISAATASVPKRTGLDPVRIRWTAASTASSPAPATRVETRCFRTSKIGAFGRSEGISWDNPRGADCCGGGGGVGDDPAGCRFETTFAGLRLRRPKASANIRAANNAITTPTAASAANGPCTCLPIGRAPPEQ